MLKRTFWTLVLIAVTVGFVLQLPGTRTVYSQGARALTPEEKAKVDAHNKLVEEGQNFLTEAKADDSPQMRAILAVGYVQLLKARADMDAFKAEKKAEVEKLTKELDEAKSLIARIKKSSTTRLRESPETSSDTAAKLSSPETPGAEALDAHAAALRR